MNVNLKFLNVASSINTLVTDKGVQSLASLPKLEKLELIVMECVTGKSFKNFKSLKSVTCTYFSNIKEGLCDLVVNCHLMEVISVVKSVYLECVNYVFECIETLLGVRTNGIPLEFHLVPRYQCYVRVTPRRSQTLYEIYEKNYAVIDYIIRTNDKEIFKNEFLIFILQCEEEVCNMQES